MWHILTSSNKSKHLKLSLDTIKKEILPLTEHNSKIFILEKVSFTTELTSYNQQFKNALRINHEMTDKDIKKALSKVFKYVESSNKKINDTVINDISNDIKKKMLNFLLVAYVKH